MPTPRRNPNPLLVIPHHDGVGPRIAAHEVRTQDRGAGRGSADHPAPRQHPLQLFVDLRVQVRVGQPPLAAAPEPDAAGTAQRRDERRRVRRVAVRRMQHRQVAGSGGAKRIDTLPRLPVRLRSARGRDQDDRRIRSACKVQEALDDGRVLHVPAHEQQRAVRRPDLLRRTRRRNGGQHRHRRDQPHRRPRHQRPPPPSGNSSSSESGSTRASFRRTVQCRWAPVTRPVAPTLPTHHAPADTVALGDIDRGQVREIGVEPPAVVDDDDVAGEVEIRRQHHDPFVRRLDGRPGAGAEIGAAVRTAGLTVENAAAAERAVRASRHRPHEPVAPVPHGCRNRKQGRLQIPLAQDAFHDLRRRVDVARLDSEPASGELLRLHRKRIDRLILGTVDRRRPQGNRVLPGLDLQIDPDQRRPHVGRPGRKEPQIGAERGALQRGRRLGGAYVQDDDLAGVKGPRPVRDVDDQLRFALPGRRRRGERHGGQGRTGTGRDDAAPATADEPAGYPPKSCTPNTRSMMASTVRPVNTTRLNHAKARTGDDG